MFLVGFFRKKPSSLRQIARVESQLSLCKIGMCQSLVFQEKTQLKCELMNLFKIGPWKVTVKETKLYSYLVISLKVSFMIWGSHSWFILNTWGLAAPSLYRTRGMWYTICFCWFWEFQTICSVLWCKQLLAFWKASTANWVSECAHVPPKPPHTVLICESNAHRSSGLPEEQIFTSITINHICISIIHTWKQGLVTLSFWAGVFHCVFCHCGFDL